MTKEERAIQDQEWSLHMAGIVVATLEAAKPKLLSLTPEQLARCIEIVAEEILVRLIMEDRPPP